MNTPDQSPSSPEPTPPAQGAASYQEPRWENSREPMPLPWSVGHDEDVWILDANRRKILVNVFDIETARFLVNAINSRTRALPSAEQAREEEPVEDAVLSRAMDLLDDVIGALDKQTYDEKRKEELEIPEDAEFEVTITAGQERKLSEVWHLLSGLLRTIRQRKSS